MSFKNIGSVIKRYAGEEHEDKNKVSLSKNIQAIKMFSHNKTPIDVCQQKYI
jgi:hypothetical protein